MEHSVFPKYVMATILMPIEVKDLEKDDFLCLQERARVSLAFCPDLPEIEEGDGYGGLSEKIRNLYDSYDKNKEQIPDANEKSSSEKGAIDISGELMIKTKEKRNKKNITYRAFRENDKSHRYTFRHW